MNGQQRRIDDPQDCRTAAHLLAGGAPVAHGFGNFYAITARGDAASVGRINVMKGRPASQVGSVTLPPSRHAEIFNWSSLPDELSPTDVQDLFDAFFELGPFGFRGPAATKVGPHLSSIDSTDPSGIRTTQLIAPGYACPSNVFLEAAAERAGDDLLYVTSANRSRHLTGADDTPAHWRGADLADEFAYVPNLAMLRHSDETAARQRYPRHLPMSTTILAFHRVEIVDNRVAIVMERHGSLDIADVRAVLDDLGFGLVLGPKAQQGLALRSYPDAA
jgi:hypothetical protein